MLRAGAAAARVYRCTKGAYCLVSVVVLAVLCCHCCVAELKANFEAWKLEDCKLPHVDVEEVMRGGDARRVRITDTPPTEAEMHYLKHREGLLKADGAAYIDDAFAEGVVCPADWKGMAEETSSK